MENNSTTMPKTPYIFDKKIIGYIDGTTDKVSVQEHYVVTMSDNGTPVKSKVDNYTLSQVMDYGHIAKSIVYDSTIENPTEIERDKSIYPTKSNFRVKANYDKIKLACDTLAIKAFNAIKDNHTQIDKKTVTDYATYVGYILWRDMDMGDTVPMQFNLGKSFYEYYCASILRFDGNSGAWKQSNNTYRMIISAIRSNMHGKDCEALSILAKLSAEKYARKMEKIDKCADVVAQLNAEQEQTQE